MMDEFIGGLVIATVITLAVAGAMFLVSGTLNSDVVKACETNGYWQTGQTRVICHVEKSK